MVFIGPYEHHSNEIPWRESIADVVTIREDADGGVDQDDLRERLEEFADRPLLIGSFSAASNVTGIVSDTYGISTLLHEHGALAFWDFAAAAPYVDIEMARRRGGDPLAYKDAIFLSPHKFIGGPSTPGVLVARRELFTQPGAGRARRRHGRLRQPRGPRVPRRPGPPRGGRHAGDHRGGAGRAGLPAQGGRGGRDDPGARGAAAARGPSTAWQQEPAIEILGNLEAPRLSIVSFVVRAPSGH